VANAAIPPANPAPANAAAGGENEEAGEGMSVEEKSAAEQAAAARGDDVEAQQTSEAQRAAAATGAYQEKAAIYQAAKGAYESAFGQGNMKSEDLYNLAVEAYNAATAALDIAGQFAYDSVDLSVKSQAYDLAIGAAREQVHSAEAVVELLESSKAPEDMKQTWQQNVRAANAALGELQKSKDSGQLTERSVRPRGGRGIGTQSQLSFGAQLHRPGDVPSTPTPTLNPNFVPRIQLQPFLRLTAFRKKAAKALALYNKNRFAHATKTPEFKEASALIKPELNKLRKCDLDQ
jgi:hypothetical protein